MKIICFKGKANTGKSTIIKRILNEFFKITLIPKDKKDFSLCFLYEGKKVGICSYGDSKRDMKKWLKPLKNEKCEIIICASHTRGETIEFVESLGGEIVHYIECGGGEERDNEKISQFNEKFKEFEKR